jgi:hypothetical protein
VPAADLGDRPHLLRETSAGKLTDNAIEEIADVWAFAAHWDRVEGRTRDIAFLAETAKPCRNAMRYFPRTAALTRMPNVAEHRRAYDNDTCPV